MIVEPFLHIIDIEEGGSKLIVGEAIVRQIFDDDILQLLELGGGITMMSGVYKPMNLPEQALSAVI